MSAKVIEAEETYMFLNSKKSVFSLKQLFFIYLKMKRRLNEKGINIVISLKSNLERSNQSLQKGKNPELCIHFDE